MDMERREQANIQDNKQRIEQSTQLMLNRNVKMFVTLVLFNGLRGD